MDKGLIKAVSLAGFMGAMMSTIPVEPPRRDVKPRSTLSKNKRTKRRKKNKAASKARKRNRK